MHERLKSILRLAGAAATGTVLPLAGVALAGHDVRPFLAFPPISDRMIHAPFAPPVFAAGLLAALALVVALAAGFRRGTRMHTTDAGTSGPGGVWPWWGYAGLALGGVTWALAWTRFPWFAPFQRYTFFPLWLAYVLTVNAWTHRRTGRCMLTHRPGYFLALFPASAAFWWWFEYLNRYVQNWQYVGLGQLTPVQYAVEATLPFATVLPAVMGTSELLASWPRIWNGFRGRAASRAHWPRSGMVIVLLGSCAGLSALGLVPDLLFPLVWVAPLGLIVALQALTRSSTVFDGLLNGNGQRVIRLALAALVCGFFWEMWNLHSLAKWVYAVPWVGAWKVFEMPVLGYLGYLPFGLLCAAVADEVETWVAPSSTRPSARTPSTFERTHPGPSGGLPWKMALMLCATPALLLSAGCQTTEGRDAGPTHPTLPHIDQANPIQKLEIRVRKLEEGQARLQRDRFRRQFEARMTADRTALDAAAWREIERLYQTDPEPANPTMRAENLRRLLEKYPHTNRAGCATLYLAQMTSGPERTELLQRAVEIHGDCWYGDGVQVGAYARFLLAWDCLNSGDTDHASALFAELRTHYPDAVTHRGTLLADRIPAPARHEGSPR